jgi:1,4-dihydroxy-2-naphthoate octaprenyltransferase
MLEGLAGVARAPFLLLPVTLVAVGAGAGAYGGAYDAGRTLIALIGLIGAHVAVNTLNEISDFRTGIDLHTRRTPFTGGSGALPDGRATLPAAWAVAAVGALAACAAGLWLLRLVGWPLVPILVAGAVAVLGYSTVLARVWLGELAAGLGLGALPVLGTALVQGGELGPAALAASVPAFFMTFNLLFLNEFPDQEADREGGRRNLVLLLGQRRAAHLYAVMALAAPAAIGVAVVSRILPPLCLWAALPSLVLVRPLRWALASPASPVPLPTLAANVVWNLATNAVLGATLFVAGRA